MDLRFDMKFNKIEKETIKAIVKYKNKAGSLADTLSKSNVLKKRGLAIVRKDDGSYYLFFRRSKYEDYDSQKVKGFLAGLSSLIEKLNEDRLLIFFSSSINTPLVIGKENVKWHQFDVMSVDNGKEYILLKNICIDWIDKNRQSLYWWEECTEMVKPIEQYLNSDYQLSQDLVELVENNFMSEEEIRFKKQQKATWISIGIAIIIGLASIIISIVKD